MGANAWIMGHCIMNVNSVTTSLCLMVAPVHPCGCCCWLADCVCGMGYQHNLTKLAWMLQIAALEEEIRKLKGVKILEPLAVSTADAQAAAPAASGRDQQKHGAAAGTARDTVAGMPAPAVSGAKEAPAGMIAAGSSEAQATPEPMQEDDAIQAPGSGVWL
jgi:hypothetical protein